MSVFYPIAPTAEAALTAPVGRAAREREALAALGLVPDAAIRFAVEETGPLFATREAALDAFAGRIDDDRPGGKTVQPEDRYCTVREVLATVKGRPVRAGPVKPVFKNGRRWPAPPPLPQTGWRISVSYWKVIAAPVETPATTEKATRSREALEAMLRQPLAPVKPQQPLDIGLFEFRAPENPGLVLPDE
jgi:hypothetical protein